VETSFNLQYAVSAEAFESKKKGEEEVTFAVTTDERTYQFKADSAASAKEWVRSIQKVIFRTHNEGNSVKISLPIQNVIEIEESSILDFADTVKVRVVDNGETFAIDEVRTLAGSEKLTNVTSISSLSSARVRTRSMSYAS
jgi:sterol 3beta-glucosyltransferase